VAENFKIDIELVILTPMYSGTCYGEYTKSLLALTQYCADLRVPVNFCYLYGDAIISRARNELLHQAMANFDSATHFLFLDADISFNPIGILKMLNSKKDFICGKYSLKTQEKNSYAFIPLDPLDLNKTGTFQVASAGTGCMMLSKKVLTELAKNTRSYYFNNAKDQKNTKRVEFFKTKINEKTKEYTSEDYEFCDNWRALGGKVWLTDWPEIRHLGTFSF